MVVLAQPLGPYKRIPLGDCNPKRLKTSGFLSGPNTQVSRDFLRLSIPPIELSFREERVTLPTLSRKTLGKIDFKARVKRS